MSVTVTDNVTTVQVTDSTTVEVTENVTSVSVTGNTATLTVAPAQTTVSVTGNTTAVTVSGNDTSVNVTSDSVGTSGDQHINGGKLTVTRTKTPVQNNVYADEFDPLLNLRTTDRSSGWFIAFGESLSNTTGRPAFGMLPNASHGSLYMGVANAGLHFQSSSSQLIVPCDNQGTTKPNFISMGTHTAPFAKVCGNSLFADFGCYIGGNTDAYRISRYETGSWTLGLTDTNTVGEHCKYWRTRDMTIVTGQWNKTSGDGTSTITGLPFTHGLVSVPTVGILHTPNGFKTIKCNSATTSLLVRDFDDSGSHTLATNGYHSFTFIYLSI